MRAVWVMAGVGIMWGLSPGAGARDAGMVPAVWKEQRLSFLYLGRTARYSCEGLRDKMRSFLLDLGARRDLKVWVLGCDESAPRAGRETIAPSLSMVFSSPTPADVNAKRLHSGDLTPLQARYQTFTLTRDAFKNYGIGDCELVEQFTRMILPRLSARQVRRDITCVPYQNAGSRYFVRGEILKAVANPAGAGSKK